MRAERDSNFRETISRGFSSPHSDSKTWHVRNPRTDPTLTGTTSTRDVGVFLRQSTHNPNPFCCWCQTTSNGNKEPTEGRATQVTCRMSFACMYVFSVACISAHSRSLTRPELTVPVSQFTRVLGVISFPPNGGYCRKCRLSFDSQADLDRHCRKVADCSLCLSLRVCVCVFVCVSFPVSVTLPVCFFVSVCVPVSCLCHSLCLRQSVSACLSACVHPSVSMCIHMCLCFCLCSL